MRENMDEQFWVVNVSLVQRSEYHIKREKINYAHNIYSIRVSIGTVYLRRRRIICMNTNECIEVSP